MNRRMPLVRTTILKFTLVHAVWRWKLIALQLQLLSYLFEIHSPHTFNWPVLLPGPNRGLPAVRMGPSASPLFD